MRKLVIIAGWVLLSLGAAPAQNAACLACHGQPGVTDAAAHSVYVDGAKQAASVHGALPCSGCHADMTGYPHPAHPAKVNCTSCHTAETGDLAAGVHAQAGGPGCQDCHGNAHAIVPVKDPASPVAPAHLPQTCGTCHGNAAFAASHHLTNVPAQYLDSIHGQALIRGGVANAASCSSCHGTHKILAHTDPASPVNRANIVTTCGGCHAGPQAQYLASIHGQMAKAGVPNAPVCTDCHSAHQIANPSQPAAQAKLLATCGTCHQESLATYHDTFHATVSDLGYQDVARCWDCHGSHTIQAVSNPYSPVAPANLVATCRQCHAGATASFASYEPHANPTDRTHYPVSYYTQLFMNLLLLSVLGFFALHTLLWFVRLLIERRAGAMRS